MDELREKHGSKFTSLQYRVWSETIVAGRHQDLENPPRGSFFKGSRVRGDKSEKSIPTAEASSPHKVSTALTPVRAAELKSTYIKQIRELHSLFEIGAIGSDDFQKQKDIILEQMDYLRKGES